MRCFPSARNISLTKLAEQLSRSGNATNIQEWNGVLWPYPEMKSPYIQLVLMVVEVFGGFTAFFDRYFSQETNVTTPVMAKHPHKNTCNSHPFYKACSYDPIWTCSCLSPQDFDVLGVQPDKIAQNAPKPLFLVAKRSKAKDHLLRRLAKNRGSIAFWAILFGCACTHKTSMSCAQPSVPEKGLWHNIKISLRRMHSDLGLQEFLF